MMTTTALATVATESRQTDDYEGAGSRPLTLLRPVGRPLRNDGIRHHWVQAGFTYRVEHDGTGWRVDSPDWSGDWTGHTYRLVEGTDMHHVDTLPTPDGGLVRLAPGQAYELRETAPGGAWGLYEV